MKEVQLYYFNDRDLKAIVFLGEKMEGPPCILPPNTGSFFKLSIKNDQTPFIKVWQNNVVFISGILPQKETQNEDKI